MSISDELGSAQVVDLPAGPIAYRQRGEGPPVVFLHGLLVNADLWRQVGPPLAETGFCCIAPDWPLGSHQFPMARDADLSPDGLAELVVQFLDALSLKDVNLVANDTGGAIAQLVLSRYPQRIARAVLTSCDAFERFFPPPFGLLERLSVIPGSGWLIAQSLRPRALHRLPITFGWVTKRAIPRAIMDSYLAPSRNSRGVQRDLRKFLRGVDHKITLEAASRLGNFGGPVLLAWATEDRLFPLELARRLADAIPDARIVEIPDSYTFIPEDQPARLTEVILRFLNTTPTTPSGALAPSSKS